MASIDRLLTITTPREKDNEKIIKDK